MSTRKIKSALNKKGIPFIKIEWVRGNAECESEWFAEKCGFVVGRSFMKASEFIRVFGLDIARMAINECPPEYDLDTVELKRLVESHELVEKCGGVDKAKKVAKSAFDSCSKIISDRSVGLECTYMNLMNAIADVEACEEIS